MSVSTISININGLKSEKLNNLAKYLNTWNHTFIFLQEIKSAYLHDFPNKKYITYIHRHCPPNQKGVAIAINSQHASNIKLINLDLPKELEKDARIIGAECTIKGKKIAAFSVYYPNQPSERKIFIENIEPILQKFQNRDLIISGDANTILYKEHSSNEDRLIDRNLLNMMTKFNLQPYPNENVSWTTHYTMSKKDCTSIIDYTLTSLPITDGTVETHSCLSDHRLVTTKLELESENNIVNYRPKLNYTDRKVQDEIKKKCTILEDKLLTIPDNNGKWIAICEELGDQLKEFRAPKPSKLTYKLNKRYKNLVNILKRQENGLCTDKLIRKVELTLDQVPGALRDIQRRLKEHLRWSHDRALNKKMIWWQKNYASNNKHLRKKIYGTSRQQSYILKVNDVQIEDPIEVANTIKNEYMGMLNYRGKNYNIDISKFWEYKKDPIPNCFQMIIRKLDNEEKEYLLNHLKSSAPNENGLRQKTIKYTSKEIQEQIFNIIDDIIMEGEVPDSMKHVSIIAIPKKGKDHLNPRNYRPITMMDSGLKLATKIIDKRVTEILKDRMSLGQFGGCKGRETIQRIFSIYNMLSWANHHNYPFHCIALDITKAYDTLPRIMLSDGLEYLGMDNDTIQRILSIMGTSYAKFLVPGGQSDTFTQDDGLKQGDVFSPNAFKICLEPLIQYLEKSIMGASVAGCWGISTGAWIDDINGFSNELEDIQQIVRDSEHFLAAYNMKLDHEKTGFLSTKNSTIFTTEGQPIHSKNTITILGNTISTDSSQRENYLKRIVEEVKRRLSNIRWNFPIQNIVRIINSDILPYCLYHLTPIYDSKTEKQIDNILKSFINERLKITKKVAVEWYYTEQKKGGLGLISLSQTCAADLITKCRKFLKNKDTPVGSSLTFISNYIREKYGYDILKDKIPNTFKPDKWFPEYIIRLCDLNKRGVRLRRYRTEDWQDMSLLPFGHFQTYIRDLIIEQGWNKLGMWISNFQAPRIKIQNDILDQLTLRRYIIKIAENIDYDIIRKESKYYQYTKQFDPLLFYWINQATLVATDGSYSKTQAGYAIVTNNGYVHKSKTLGQATAFNSEVQAIHTAMNHIRNDKEIHIITDAKSILDQIQGKKSSNDPYIQDIKQMLISKPHIRFSHIKSHTGNSDQLSRLNEKADQMAKLARKACDCFTQLPNPEQWFITIKDTLITHNTRKLIYTHLLSLSISRKYQPKHLPPLNRNFANIYPCVGIGHRTINTITRARLDAMQTFDNINKRNRKYQHLCTCGCKETFTHTIMKCPNYKHIRREMWNNLYAISYRATKCKKKARKILFRIRINSDLNSLLGASIGLGPKWDKIFAKEAYKKVNEIWNARNKLFMEDMQMRWEEDKYINHPYVFPRRPNRLRILR